MKLKDKREEKVKPLGEKIGQENQGGFLTLSASLKFSCEIVKE
jgi:hypothetical protein